MSTPADLFLGKSQITNTLLIFLGFVVILQFFSSTTVSGLSLSCCLLSPSLSLGLLSFFYYSLVRSRMSQDEQGWLLFSFQIKK
jgi:hypothetical protein